MSLVISIYLQNIVCQIRVLISLKQVDTVFILPKTQNHSVFLFYCTPDIFNQLFLYMIYFIQLITVNSTKFSLFYILFYIVV